LAERVAVIVQLFTDLYGPQLRATDSHSLEEAP
jgi:hypothetical protein